MLPRVWRRLNLASWPTLNSTHGKPTRYSRVRQLRFGYTASRNSNIEQYICSIVWGTLFMGAAENPPSRDIYVAVLSGIRKLAGPYQGASNNHTKLHPNRFAEHLRFHAFVNSADSSCSVLYHPLRTASFRLRFQSSRYRTQVSSAVRLEEPNERSFTYTSP